MELLTNLETYINAQKNVGTQFILIGILLMIVAAWSHFSDTSSLTSGLKTGSFICSLFILIGGFGYRYTENTLLKNQTELFEKNQTEFKQVEMERMVKVKKDYPIYQIVFGSFIVLSLLLIWFVKKHYWHGVAFAIILLMLCVMIVEAFSQRSINQYYESLIN